MAQPRRSSASSDTASLPSSGVELPSSYDYLAKIILLGPSGAGKSCLLHRFVNHSWRVLSSQTIGVEFSSKIVKIGTGPSRRRIKLQLWDTAGTERFRSVSRSYYRGAAGAILVYDVANLASFNALPTFLLDARALASPNLTVILAGNKADLGELGKQEQGLNGSAQPILPTTASSMSSRQSGFPYDTGGSVGSGRSRVGSISMTAGTKWTATTSSEGREVMSDFASRWASKSGVPVTMEVSALTGDNVDELFNRLARIILTKIELGEIDPDNPQNGIQYGDVGWGGGASIKSGTTLDNGTLRRRKKKGKVLLNGMSEWGDVFRSPVLARGGRKCC